MRKARPLAVGLAALWLALPAAAGSAKAQDLVIGSGPVGDVPFHVGRSLCRLFEAATEGLTCAALATSGSLFNLSNVRGGALEIGLVPADLQHDAVAHSGAFAFMDDTYENLRSLFSLQAEPFTLVARGGAGIAGLDDLVGRRVNIGEWGSDPRALMDLVMAAKGWTEADFLLVQDLPAAEQSLAFCHDRFDAMVEVAAHPDRAIERLATLCGAVLVDVSGPAIDRLMAENAYLVPVEIAGGTYPGTPGAVSSFGVRLTAVTSAEVDAGIVYAFVKSVFDDLDKVRRMSPALAGLKRRDMTSQGLTAPLHEGARRFFREQGLM